MKYTVGFRCVKQTCSRETHQMFMFKCKNPNIISDDKSNITITKQDLIKCGFNFLISWWESVTIFNSHDGRQDKVPSPHVDFFLGSNRISLSPSDSLEQQLGESNHISPHKFNPYVYNNSTHNTTTYIIMHHFLLSRKRNYNN